MIVTSRKNVAAVHYRSLVRERAYRREHGEFPIEGARLCEEAVKSGLEITSFLVTQSAAEKYAEAFGKIAKTAAPLFISDDVAAYISDTKSPQGMFLTAKTLDKPILSGKIEEGGHFLLLDGLQDSGNIGTIIRTADAFGLDGIILSPDCADIYSPKIVRSAMGSLFRLPLIETELSEFISRLKKAGYAVYAAMLDKDAQRLEKIKFGAKTAVIIGNEGNGVSKEVYCAAGQKLYIPIENAESLNAAVAASIIGWELSKEKGKV